MKMNCHLVLIFDAEPDEIDLPKELSDAIKVGMQSVPDTEVLIPWPAFDNMSELDDVTFRNVESLGVDGEPLSVNRIERVTGKGVLDKRIHMDGYHEWSVQTLFELIEEGAMMENRQTITELLVAANLPTTYKEWQERQAE